MRDKSSNSLRVAAAKIVGLYSAVGVFWLFAFDWVIDRYDLRRMENYGDFLFICVSSAVFYHLLVYHMQRYDAAQRGTLVLRHNEELREINEELARSNAELEEFAYVASHDLRQPLRMVSSYLSLTERRLQSALDEETRQFMGFARDGAQRMDNLIVDLLEYSRIGRQAAPKEQVSLSEAVAHATKNLEVAIGEAAAEIDIAPDLPTVIGNQTDMTRLFQNLIGNAIKYNDPARPPKVEVSARREGELWVISVSDNGIGIDPLEFERIFGVFQRLHPRGQYEGSGIGLAVCRKIVQQHGGRISVNSSPGDGSEFQVTLPCIDAARPVLLQVSA